MRRALSKLLTLLALLPAGLAIAQPAPVYDEVADAQADVQRALTDAALARVPVLLVFGANWCGDCKVLDLAFKSGAAAPVIQRKIRVV
jgi:thioredoxin 1